MTLRPYQRECLEAIRAAYHAGARRQLVALPTGTGKTMIFAELPAYFRMKNRMLVLAHREELIDQAAEKIARANPALSVGIEKAGTSAPPDARVVIASVQTLGRRASSRLLRMDPEPFRLIVIDEAHHAVAPSYLRVLEHFGVMADDSIKLVVGFTATPVRGDKAGLERVFQKIVYSRSIIEMIRRGYLCPILGYRVETKVDLSQVRTQMGDFSEQELARTVNEAPRNAALVKAYQQIASGTRALVFCVDVQHTRDVARAFEAAGLTARPVWGEMPTEERANAITAFRDGRVSVLTNCNVLTEGFDEPKIECVLLGRPTQSPLLYTQMIGRGTRTAPGKKAVKVVDVVDNTSRHRLMALPRLFGLPERFDLKGKSVTSIRANIERLARIYPFLNLERMLSPDDIDLVIRRVALIKPELAEEVRRHSEFVWIRMPDDSYRLPLEKGQWLLIEPNLLDRYEVRILGRYDMEQISEEFDLANAFGVADATVRERFKDVVPLLGQHLRWRRQPATSKQIETLKGLCVTPPEGLTKGDAQPGAPDHRNSALGYSCLISGPSNGGHNLSAA
ncbi:MAG: DEAD/DEAH box helicase [Acidobacteria bacterium]|nr:DEAD/DEAH box helicase [Acidobacteriota bacterium]